MPGGLRVKSFFFDRQRVMDALPPAARAALSKAGAFIRTRAKSSMRRRKAISKAGQPPSAHEGSVKRLLFFSYDPSSRSVVTGPEKFGEGKAPSLLEFGGNTRIKAKGGSRTAHYTPRPYMKPALDAEISAGTIPGPWASSIKS